MLRIVVEQSMDSALLRCSGRLVAGKEVLRLREAVMCQAEKRSVQLDLAGVEAIDAAGLGLLVSLHTLGWALGFGFQVRNPVPRVRSLLKLTRLESVLDIHPSDEAELKLTAGASSSDSYFGGTKSPMRIRDKAFLLPDSA
jgi:anti-anti-sigma factor